MLLVQRELPNDTLAERSMAQPSEGPLIDGQLIGMAANNLDASL